MSLLGSLSGLFGERGGSVAALGRVGGTLANTVLSFIGGGKPQTQAIISGVTGGEVVAPTTFGGRPTGGRAQLQIIERQAMGQAPPSVAPTGPELGDIETGAGRFGAIGRAVGRGIARQFVTPGDVMSQLGDGGSFLERVAGILGTGGLGVPGAIGTLGGIFGGPARALPSPVDMFGGGTPVPQEAPMAPMDFGGGLFQPTQLSARPLPLIMASNPVTGRITFWKHVGRPILFSGDLATCKRVNRIARRARRKL